MDRIDEMKAFHAMETIKDAPEFMQDMQLMLLCKADPGGRFERISRILANYGMESQKIVPCLMEIMEDFLLHKDSGDNDVIRKSDQIRERAQKILRGDE